MAAGSKELSARDRPKQLFSSGTKIKDQRCGGPDQQGFPEIKVVVNPVQAHNPVRFFVLLGRLSQGVLGTRKERLLGQKIRHDSGPCRTGLITNYSFFCPHS